MQHTSAADLEAAEWLVLLEQIESPGVLARRGGLPAQTLALQVDHSVRERFTITLL